MQADCKCGVCGKCRATKLLIGGIVLFIATWYAKSTGNVYLIWYTLAALLVLKALMKFAIPNCPHCSVEMPKKKK